MLRREAVGIDDCALYPLFDDTLLTLMRRLIAPERQHAVGVAIVLRAQMPGVGATRSARATSAAASGRRRAR